MSRCVFYFMDKGHQWIYIVSEKGIDLTLEALSYRLKKSP